MNLIYALATVVLAVVLLVAAIGKWIQPKAEKSSIGLMALTEKPAFAWMQIACAAVLLLPLPCLVHASRLEIDFMPKPR